MKVRRVHFFFGRLYFREVVARATDVLEGGSCGTFSRPIHVLSKSQVWSRTDLQGASKYLCHAAPWSTIFLLFSESHISG